MRDKNSRILMTLIAGLLCGTGVANAQTTVNQLLDSTFMHGQDVAAEMAFNDATQRDPDPEYTYLGITGTNLSACKLTAIDGLFCLDGKTVRNWPSPTQQVDVGGTLVVPSFDVVDCEDPVLGLDRKKANTCTGLTVDLEGNIWLAGKSKGKTHSLIKLVPANPTCPSEPPFAGAIELGVLESNVGLCAYEVATGRPLLVDLAPIDGELADEFALPGHAAPLVATLGLEQRKTAVAFLASGEIIEIASGKGWGLKGREQLLGITMLQLVDEAGVNPTQNIIFVVTTSGRVLAWDATSGAKVGAPFDIEAHRETATVEAGPCNSDDPVYSIRASNKTSTVYVTDSEYCEVIALEATKNGDDEFTGLANVKEDGPNLTLSTRGLTSPTGITVAPGISVDLNDCTDPDPDNACPLVTNEGGVAIAKLSGVQLFDYSVSGLSLFQVVGIPDCRYVPRACLEPLGRTVQPGTSTADVVELLMSEEVGVIVPLLPGTADALNPAAQRLNVTPLLPDEITDLYPDLLPPMLVARYVRGQQISDFHFGAFFGVTQDGVIFRDTFESEYDVFELADAEYGCDNNPDSLLWDVIGTVSERHGSASDTYPNGQVQHLMSIVNSDCGSSRGRDRGFSLKPYNLEPTPCTFNPDTPVIWSSDGSCALPDPTTTPEETLRTETVDDAVNAKMLLILADEYSRTLDQLACLDSYGENGGTPPLTPDNCATLQGQVFNMVDKLHKCWDATMQPKQSSGDQNCQAFDSQLTSLQNTLEGISPVDPDVANRVGELKARAMTMRHVFETRFVPSLPDEGFDEP